MTPTCATCQWSKPVVARVDLTASEAVKAARIICNRMPQTVENDASYSCGEYIRKRGEAA